jgi:hypothetical protein
MPNRRTKLWERDLSIDITKTQYDSLFLSESEAYDFHTIIVPSVLRVSPKAGLCFEAGDAVLREVRCPRGYRIITIATVGTDSVRCSTRPPQSPISETPAIAADSLVPLRIEVYAFDTARGTVSEPSSGSRLLLWSGLSELSSNEREFEVIEEFSQPEQVPWPMRTHYIPRYLHLTKDLKLIREPSDSVEITLIRSPETVLLAALASGNERITRLPPDLAGIPISLTSASLHGDTLTCRLDLYERRIGSVGIGSYETLYSHQYLVPLSRKQAKGLRKHLKGLQSSLVGGLGMTYFR